MSIDDYRPTFVVEAVYDLKADDLLRHGIHAVLVDLDNTLIAWNNPDGTPEVRAWLDEMTMADISVVGVSNNSYSRVDRALSRFGVDFVSRAMKPFTRGISIVFTSDRMRDCIALSASNCASWLLPRGNSNSSCCVEITMVSMRKGTPSSLYSTVTCDLASGRR